MATQVLTYVAAVVCLSFLFWGASANPSHFPLTPLSLWPQPLKWDMDFSAQMYLTKRTFSFRSVGHDSLILQRAFRRYRTFTFDIPEKSAPNTTLPLLQKLIVNITSTDTSLSSTTDESYSLFIWAHNQTAQLTASTVYGGIHGLETFSQLVRYDLSKKLYFLDTHVIYDKPRFAYRGVMLDTSRMFMTLPVIKRVINAMSHMKLNVLHLHLIDTQSWPIEIPSYPKLAGNGSYTSWFHTYTTADIKQLVLYARDRAVRLIPEIDTPSHSDSIVFSYPEFLTLWQCGNQTCRSMPDPTSPATWKFLTSIFSDVADMFPDDMFHIGGDEFWYCWNTAPAVQQFMKDHNMTSIVDVYFYYERTVIDIMRSLGKKVIAWEDIGGFPQNDPQGFNAYPDVVMDVWTGWAAGSWQSDFEYFTSRNASVILSGPWYATKRPTSLVHRERLNKLAHRFSTNKVSYLPSATNIPDGALDVGFFTWEDMYKVDPHNFTGTDAQKRLVHGGHLAAWDDALWCDSSDVLLDASLQMSAVAEVLWSPQAKTAGFDPPKGRLHDFRCRLLRRNIPSHPVYAYSAFCPVEAQ